MAQERKGAATFQGGSLTLVGPELKAGDKAPDFKLIDTGLKAVTLADSKGKVRLVSVVPSIDTPVCDLQTKRFNQEASKLPANVAVLTVSMDLPFAQKRFCQEFDINKVKTLSDHRDADFGVKFGVLIKELRLLARAIFILDKDDNVKYVEYVKELGNPPNYDAALKALKEII